MDNRTAAKLRRQLGYLTLPEVAEMCGVERRKFSGWVERGLLPRPTVNLGSKRRYYPKAVVDGIREQLKGA